jgi:hypothetical protein
VLLETILWLPCIFFSHAQDPQFIATQWIGAIAGLMRRLQKVLHQRHMIDAQIFHANIQQQRMIAGHQALGRSKTRQSLIAFVTGRKGLISCPHCFL